MSQRPQNFRHMSLAWCGSEHTLNSDDNPEQF